MLGNALPDYQCRKCGFVGPTSEKCPCGTYLISCGEPVTEAKMTLEEALAAGPDPVTHEVAPPGGLVVKEVVKDTFEDVLAYTRLRCSGRQLVMAGVKMFVFLLQYDLERGVDGFTRWKCPKYDLSDQNEIDEITNLVTEICFL